MCHFIHIILSATAKTEPLQGMFAQFHRRLEEIKPQHLGPIKPALKSDERAFLTTHGMCDCGTQLGCSARRTVRPPWSETKIEKLHKDGWSESKIARWKEQKEKSYEKNAHPSLDEKRLSEIERWKDLLTLATESRLASYIGVIVHWASDPVDAERVKAHRGELSKDFLMHMRENTIYEFYP